MLDILKNHVDQLFVIMAISFVIFLITGLCAWVTADNPSLHKWWKRVSNVACWFALGLDLVVSLIKAPLNKFFLTSIISAFIILIGARLFKWAFADNPSQRKLCQRISDFALLLIIGLILYSWLMELRS